MMRETHTAESRPYHHGDLRRALIDAARRLLEAEGPSALSLRAVAREAGVSPAASLRGGDGPIGRAPRRRPGR